MFCLRWLVISIPCTICSFMGLWILNRLSYVRKLYIWSLHENITSLLIFYSSHISFNKKSSLDELLGEMSAYWTLVSKSLSINFMRDWIEISKLLKRTKQIHWLLIIVLFYLVVLALWYKICGTYQIINDIKMWTQIKHVMGHPN